ncbi:class I SAM-dependent methyltransferase [Candidatus Poribacteria bacterium]|nr:class I SAM-dependent methyltransferase [Candidatus Poribacteria bacterium]
MTMGERELRRFYEDQYGKVDESFIRWRSLCAEDKVRNIVDLTRGMNFGSVIDIGSGTGAVIKRLSEMDFAESYYAVDLSERAIRIVRSAGIKGLRGALVADAAMLPFSDKSFDLAILSHVLEHVAEPKAVLREASRIARLVFVEIPIENTPILNFTWWLRKIIRGRKRPDNRYGHVIFFTERSADDLYRRGGLVKRRSRRYILDRERMLFQKRGFWYIYNYLIYLLSRLLGGRLTARLYYCHYAALLKGVGDGGEGA